MHKSIRKHQLPSTHTRKEGKIKNVSFSLFDLERKMKENGKIWKLCTVLVPSHFLFLSFFLPVFSNSKHSKENFIVLKHSILPFSLLLSLKPNNGRENFYTFLYFLFFSMFQTKENYEVPWEKLILPPLCLPSILREKLLSSMLATRPTTLSMPLASLALCLIVDFRYRGSDVFFAIAYQVPVC